MVRVNRFGRIAGSLLAALLITLLATQVALADPPDSSGAVSRFTEGAGFGYWDEADGLIALGGPLPEEGCFGEGFDDPALVMVVETPSGATKVTIRQGPTPVFVYALDVHPCEVIFEGGVPEPVYVGWMRTVLTDNDADVSLTRVNSFGTSSTGFVWDADGNRCHFNAHARLQITLDDEFVPVVPDDINIRC